MLKGVSVARRKRLNPAAVTTSRIRASPACAPRHSPTSCDREQACTATSKTNSTRGPPDSDCPSSDRLQKAQRSSTCRLSPVTAGRAWPPRPDRPCRAGNRRPPRSRNLSRKLFGFRNFESDAVRESVALRGFARRFDRFVMVVESEEARIGESLRHQQGGRAFAAADVGHSRARLEFFFDVLRATGIQELTRLAA